MGTLSQAHLLPAWRHGACLPWRKRACAHCYPWPVWAHRRFVLCARLAGVQEIIPMLDTLFDGCLASKKENLESSYMDG